MIALTDMSLNVNQRLRSKMIGGLEKYPHKGNRLLWIIGWNKVEGKQDKKDETK